MIYGNPRIELAAIELAEASDELSDLLENRKTGGRVPVAGKNLSHPDHVNRIDPIKKKVARLFKGYFKRQEKAILDDVRLRFWDHEMPVREADGKVDGQKRAMQLMPESLSPLNFAANPAETESYDGYIAAAIDAAQKQLIAEIDYQGTIGDNPVTSYLKEKSLSRLTGELAETTKQRLRDAIATAVDAGGTADEIVGAIQDTMEDFSTRRANLIAQTEVNAAYNFARQEMADQAGMTHKRWVTESGRPCDVCLDNAFQDWIEFDERFASGDYYPPGHPMCMCALDYKLDTQNEGK